MLPDTCMCKLSANVTRLVFCKLNCHGRKVCVWIFNFTSPVYSPKLVEHVEKYYLSYFACPSSEVINFDGYKGEMVVESYNTIHDILLTAYKGDYAILVFLFC
jgi:hypothetical protein